MATEAKQKAKQASSETPEIEALGIEYGAELNLPFSTPYSGTMDGTRRSEAEERLVEVSRAEYGVDHGPTVRQLVAMRRMDGQARALYRLLTLPIRSALNSSTFVPAEGGDEEAEFIKQVFHLPPDSGGMSVTFHRFMSQMLQGLFDGFAAFEKVFWVPPKGPLEGKITLKKLAHRPAETVTFLADDRGGFAGFRQQTSVHGKSIDVRIPTQYAFYYAAQEEERKFYGVSYFQSAFYHYDKKVKLYYTAHLAAQRAAVGTRVGTVPANASKNARAEFAKNLANLSLAQWMTLPEGFKVDLLREGGSFDFLNLINHHNNQMSKSVLANFFDQATGGGSNDASLVNFAQPGDDMFVLMLRAIMDDIANQINHYIIPQLIDLNFDSGLYPTFTWGKLTDEQRAAVSAVFDKIVVAGQGVNATPEFMRALEEQIAADMGLEIDYEEIEKREQAEALLQQQQGIGPDGQPLPQQQGTGPDGQPLPGAAPAAGDAAGDEFAQAQQVSEEDLGLTGEWSLEDFEDALDRFLTEGGPQAGDQVTLSGSSVDPLLLLAAEMLRAAAQEDARA